LYVIHTLNPQGDRNRFRVLGADLPALLLSKNIGPEYIRGPDSHRSAFLPEGLGFSGDESRQKVAHKIRNPASSAGHNRLLLAVPREARQNATLCS